MRNGFQNYSFVASGINGVIASNENPLGLTVLPNPASSNCILRFKPIDNSNAVITIFSVSGQKIQQQIITPTLPITNYSLNINSLSKGIYIINLQQNNLKCNSKLEKL